MAQSVIRMLAWPTDGLAADVVSDELARPHGHVVDSNLGVVA